MSDEIESHLQEQRRFEPSENFKKNSHLKSVEEYNKLYKESVEDPETFWGRLAEQEIEWIKKWDEVLSYDFDSIGEKEAPYVEFFKGGKLNISYNCLDRHLDLRGDKTALIWESDDGTEERKLSYRELHRKVCRLANVLKNLGAKKGTTVTIYLPMIPQAVIAMQACARIGAIHSVVFSAFSAEALKNRIHDCDSQLVITSDVGLHAGKTVELKKKVDDAVADCPTIKHVLVYKRGDGKVSMQSPRDRWWHEEEEQVEDTCEPEVIDAEDPLFLLFTSGSTGKPKGVLHTTGGYLLYTHTTFKYIFDIKDDDIFWCTADVGWITGHSYVTYGPLSNGATCLIFEGVPTYPNPDRFWKLVEKYKVTSFYTAPTAIRALMRLGDDWPKGCDLSSLRLLGTVGEPINPEAWIWYHKLIGNEQCPIVDTWWQTETGGFMIMTFPGAHSTKPGCAGKPFFGIVPEVVKDDGSPAAVNEGGSLVIKTPWPGMIRGVYGDPKNELIKNTYFSAFPGKYLSGDGARLDEDGYLWLLGRIDDVINVSAHRFATAEIESSLVSHEKVTEAAVVGCPHETKGQAIYCFVTLKQGIDASEDLEQELVNHVREDISPIATPETIHFTPLLPKTRSGKIMRRVLRKIAEKQIDQIGDLSTLADPSVVDMLLETRPS